MESKSIRQFCCKYSHEVTEHINVSKNTISSVDEYNHVFYNRHYLNYQKNIQLNEIRYIDSELH